LFEPPLIAVVDDDEDVREALCDLLQVEGLSARGFAGAEAFLDNHAPGRFHLLITDVRMPHIDGIELLRRLRGVEAPPPAIVLTSLSDDATRMRAIEEGALACLTKPVTDEALLALVRSILERGAPEAPEA
jgi:two-component system response regulator FixJ